MIINGTHIDPSVFLKVGETFGGFRQKQQVDKALDFFFNNIEVWSHFFRLSMFLKNNQRRKKMGAQMVMERLRWDLVFELKKPELEHKLNNNYTPFYSRVFNAYLRNENQEPFYDERTSMFDPLDLRYKFWDYLKQFDPVYWDVK